MKVSYISDLHLDFHAQFTKSQIKWQQRTEDFIMKIIETDEGERNILVIAGDISHFNSQSLWALKKFSEYYKQVIFTVGNHDYYLVSKNQSRIYGHSSKRRIDELYELSKLLSDNIHPLFTDEIFEYEGITFGGNPLWYPLETIEQQIFFQNNSNDSIYIKGFNIKDAHHQSMKEYESLLNKNIDIMISHVPVINVDSHYRYNSTVCYLTYVKEIQVKHWIMGHSHDQKVYEKPYCTFYMNALGYPEEQLSQSVEHFTI